MPNKVLPHLRFWSYSKSNCCYQTDHLKSSKRSICRRSLKKWLDMLSWTLPFDPSDSISCEFSPPLPPNLSLKWYEARAFTAARHLSTTSLSCNRPKKKELYHLEEYKFALQCKWCKTANNSHTTEIQGIQFVRDTRSEWGEFHLTRRIQFVKDIIWLMTWKAQNHDFALIP